MQPVPCYQFDNAKTAYHLRYAWTAWPSSGNIPEVDLEAIKPPWENDGLRLLESCCTPRAVQLAFSARPFQASFTNVYRRPDTKPP